VGGHDEVGSDEPAARSHQAANERCRDPEGRVGDDAEGLAGEPEIGGVGHDHDDCVVAKPLPELLGSAVVQFDSDHAGSSRDQGRRQCSPPSSDVKDEVSG